MDVKERVKVHLDERLKAPEKKRVIPVNPALLEYKVDPIQDKRIREKMMKNPEYAMIMNKNETALLYRWLVEKVMEKENIIMEIKGHTRSGKSIVGISIGKLITKLVNHYFKLNRQFKQFNVCKNESEYFQKIRFANKKGVSFNSTWVVDEQKETHTGVGSYSELTLQEDINNIVAIECIHTIWIHPPHFVGRNALVGLETYGKNKEYRVTRCIMYDLHENQKVGVPMGLAYIPVIDDPEFEGKYIEKKWEQVDDLLTGKDISGRVDARFRIAKKLSENSMFLEAPNNTIRLAIARKYCPFGLPDSAVKEIMSIARLPKEHIDEMMKMKTDADLKDISLEELGWGGEDY
jgi:hypothetical protein